MTAAAPLRAIAEELVRCGVRDVVICPGSRSTPLALALRVAPALRCWVHLDERSGAFFALGAAKAARRPVAIVVTSGSAAAELLPAIVEARHGRVPLIALTADRPPELRDRGAPQAIDQDHLFGRFAKWYAELPVPEDDERAIAHVRGTIARAVSVATAAPAGPVHLDLPYREPLLPEGDLAWPAPDPGMDRGVDPNGGAAGDVEVVPYVRAVTGARAIAEGDLAELAGRVAAARRGVIVCGPLDEPGFAPAVAGLAAATGFPIIADALANVRFGSHDRSAVIARADLLLAVPGFAALQQPDLVLRFGGTPTSRVLLDWLVAGAAPQIVVDDGGWHEPTLLPVTMVHAEPVRLARDLADRLQRTDHARDAGAVRAAGEHVAEERAAGWLDSWLAADSVAAATTADWLAGLDEPFEGQVFSDLGTELPPGAILLAGNSMPVRDAELFLAGGPGQARCLGNRGANGIDGLLSTALGMAAVADAPVVAVVGDVSFLHDLAALLSAARLGLSATFVVVNNDGGGIFSFLPQAAAEAPTVGLPDHFEQLFGTPHGTDLGPLVRAMGASHILVASAEVGAAVVSATETPGVHVLEVRTERRRNVELHRELRTRVAAAIEAMLSAADMP